MADRPAEIDRARDAVAREAWADAFDLLRSIPPSELVGRDLEDLAEAAWWRSEIDASIAARQRAHAAYIAEGDVAQAGYMAARLSIQHFLSGEPSVGAGWLKRAERHLQDLPECVPQGFLALIEGTVALQMGDAAGALERSRRAIELGRRFGDPDLVAMSTVAEGIATISSGQVDDGLALLDEAMTSVIAGELSTFFTGAVYCNVLEACLEVTDVRRAGEWSEAARSWCRSIPSDSPYPGLCRINRAEVARLRGDWAEAETEATRAIEELTRTAPEAAAGAHYKVGEVRLRLDDLAGAESAFAQAHALGFDPQPGLALLRLAQGRVEAAQTALRLARSDRSAHPFRRAVLLAAGVEVELAGADLEAAGAARDELAVIADAFPTSVLHAAAATARGSVALAAGEIPEAFEYLRRATAAWQELRLPYDTARARVGYGLAIRASGDEEDATLELRAALAAFERLGARADAASTAALLGERGLPRGLTAREAEVLRLVASGKTNRDIAVELVISEHTVARHLQNMFAKLDVTSRSAATAFAFEHGLA